MPDCSIRNWAMKRGWQERWTMVQSEAFVFLHNPSAQFLLMFGPVLHPFYLLPHDPLHYLKKDTRLTYFCQWLHSCIFLLVWIDFIFDTWCVYLNSLSSSLFMVLFLPMDCIYCCVYWHAASLVAGLKPCLWGESEASSCHPKPFRKSLWKLMW